MLRFALCLLCGWLLGGGVVAVRAAALPPDWREQARRLSAEDFSERQAAQQWMLSAPRAAAVPWLVEVASAGDAEGSRRALLVLERWLLTAPPDLADQVEEQLERLSRAAPLPTAVAASDVLTVQRRLRQQRAVLALRQLGAKVDVGPDLEEMATSFNVAHEEVDPYAREHSINAQIEATNPEREVLVLDDELNDPREAPAAALPRHVLPQIPRQVFLTQRWTGGDEGARHLRRLTGVGTMHVYVVRGCQTSLESVLAATAEIEGVQVQERGPSLGVGNGGSFECVIGRVLTGGAADQAGLEVGDVIVGVGEEPIESFVDLVNTIADYQPGDEVEITLLRGLRADRKTVKLGDWTDVDTEGELWKPNDGRGIMPRRLPLFFPPQPPMIPQQPNNPQPNNPGPPDPQQPGNPAK